MMRTAKDTQTGICKTSAMPVLMYSVPKEAQRGRSPPTVWGGVDQSCRNVRIRLMPGGGWRVSGASYDNAAV